MRAGMHSGITTVLVTLILIAISENNLYAQESIHNTQLMNSSVCNEANFNKNNTLTISGALTDENDIPAASVIVEAVINDKIIDGDVTDTNGKYIIKNIPFADLTLRTYSLEYSKKEIFLPKYDLHKKKVFNISLTTVETFNNDCNFYTPLPLIDKYSTGNNRTISREEIQHMSR